MPNHSTYRKAMIPYIVRLAVNSFLLIIFPLSIFLLKADVDRGEDASSVWTFRIIVLMYILFLFYALTPGVKVLLDFTAGSFVQENLHFVEGVMGMNPYIYLMPNGLRKYPFFGSKWSSHEQVHFYHMYFAGYRKKIPFKLSYFHLLKADHKYKVTYGRYSKVIVSIRDRNGQECILFDVW